MNPPLHVLFAAHELAATRPHRMDLRRRGARVDFADRPDLLLEQVRAEPPDLVVLDENLENGRTEGLIARVESAAPEAELIVLHEDSDSLSHGLGLGLLLSARKPLSRASLIDVVDSAFPGRLEAGPPAPEEPRVLLYVDDQAQEHSALTQFLRQRGYQVIVLKGASKAHDALRHLRPFLAILTIRLPGMEGLGLLCELRKNSNGEILVLTPLGSEEICRRALQSGASHCLTEPCSSEDILNIVDTLAGDLDDTERQILKRRMSRPVDQPQGAGTRAIP